MSFSKWKRPEYAVHLADLRKRQIKTNKANARGYVPLTPDEMYKAEGIRGNAIKLPCRASDGTLLDHARYRLLDADVIRQRGGKYHQRSKSGVHPHFGKKFSRKLATIITEGEIKADEAADALSHYNTISVPGVSSWRGADGKLHPEFCVLKNSDVEIAYDTDQTTKPQVWQQQLALADVLSNELGCTVSIVELQSVPNADKTGLDDYLQHYGADQYRKLPRHTLDSPFVKAWRDKLSKNANTLPAVLRDLRPFDPDWYDKKPPPIEWVVEGLLQKSESALVVGPGGVGKTYLLLNAAASIASGRQFFVYPTRTKRKVLYLMLERHSNSLRRRWNVLAHAMADGIAEPGDRAKFERDIKANVFLHSLAGESLNLVEYKNQQWHVNEPVVDSLIAELLAAGIEVLFIDPYSRLHGGNESDNSVSAVVTKALERVFSATGCAVVLVHHTGKTERSGQYAGRGGSALSDNTSECIVLHVLDKAERDKIDLSSVRDDEVGAEIVLLNHARASDGPRSNDLYLVRHPKTGLLRHINVTVKSTGEILGELTHGDSKLVKWAGKESFSQTMFVRDRARVLGNKATVAEAKDVFANLISAGALVAVFKDDGTPLKPRGGQRYKLEDTGRGAQTRSAPAVVQTTKPLHKGSRNDARN